MSIDTNDVNDYNAVIQRMMRGEVVPLDKRLQDCIFSTSMLGMQCIKHPLVFSLPYIPIENERLNLMLAHKEECIEIAARDRNIHTYVAAHERPYRIGALHSYIEKVGLESSESKKYWDALGWAWCDSENIHENPDAWINLWICPPEGINISNRMSCLSDSDRQAWDTLPQELTIYHGEERDDEIGWSWTLDQDVALWFANRFANGEPRGHYSGTVQKKDVVVYLNRRNEHEIIVNPDDVAMGPRIGPDFYNRKMKRRP